MTIPRDINIRKYFLYTFIYSLYPINAIIALFFLAKGLNYAEIGIVFGVFSVAGFLFEIPTGFFGDKYGRRMSVIVGLAIMALTSFAWTYLANVYGFAVFAAMWMLGLTFISGSFDAYIFEYLKSKGKEKSYDKVLSTVGSLGYFAAAVGSILGAYLYSLNVNFPYYLLSGIFLFSAAIVATMEPETKIKDGLVKSELKVFSGLKYVLSSKKLVLITLFLSLLFGFYDYYIHSVDKPFILSLNVFDVKWLGVFVAITFVVQSALASQFALLKKKLGEFGVLTLCWFVFAGSLLAMSQLYGIVGLVAVVFFYSIEPFRDAILNSFSQEHIPSEIRATTLSSIKVYESIAGAFLGVVAGLVFDYFDIRTGMLIGFGYAVIVYALTYLYRVRNRVDLE